MFVKIEEYATRIWQYRKGYRKKQMQQWKKEIYDCFNITTMQNMRKLCVLYALDAKVLRKTYKHPPMVKYIELRMVLR